MADDCRAIQPKLPQLLKKPVIDVIIPAYNEEKSIALVLKALPWNYLREVIVSNNGSKDQTAEVARKAGATVVDEPNKGYGSACLKAMGHIASRPAVDQPDVVVFLDGDYSDYPEELPLLVQPLLDDSFDLVIGSRVLGKREQGALLPQQRFGNWLATTLMRWIYGYSFTDLGPFRAIRWNKLLALQMEDPNFGWTVEMQIKAAKKSYACTEVPVRYRKRVGISKVSGTIRGTFLAGHKILWLIFKLR